jgi:hypothetical protein
MFIACLQGMYSIILDLVLRDGLSSICVNFRYPFRYAFLYKALMAMSKKDRSRNSSCCKDRAELVDPSQSQRTDPGWQLLCELELPVVNDVEQTVHGWMAESLEPLALQKDFMNKVLRSAQRAVARTVRREPGLKLEYIQIMVFVPLRHDVKDQSWGFFRIEKSIAEAQNAVARGQTIVFYLYLEG